MVISHLVNNAPKEGRGTIKTKKESKTKNSSRKKVE